MRIDPKTKLESERCVLRYISLEDIPFVFSATRYAGFNDGMLWNPPESIDELYASYHRNVKAWEEGRAYSFSIDCKDTNEFIGRITIRKSDTDNVWEIGYWTHPEKQSKGYMSEVVPEIIRFGFTKLKAEKIIAKCAVWNIASEKVMKKAGMKYVCSIQEGFFKNGVWVEENEYEILNTIQNINIVKR